MTPRPRRRTLARALLWTGVSLAIGLVLFFIAVGNEWPAYEDAGVHRAELSRELFFHIVFGIIALTALPIVLQVDGRTIPRTALRPKVLAAEKLRELLTTSGRGGEEFLANDGSVESLQRGTGGWVPVLLGIIGILTGTISFLGVVAASILIIALAARQSWLLSFGALLASILSQTAGYVLTPTAVGQFELPLFLVNGTVFAAFVVIGVIRGSREQRLIDTAAQTLLRERSRQDRAVAEVRRGIARDMHDSLSHHLSVIAMYSGALSVRRDLDPESVHESARLIANSARRSGIELREVLTMLRGDDQGTVIDSDLERLVADRVDTVELDCRAPLTTALLRSVGSLERTTIYRFAQEAITNALKHAPGQKLTITLSWDVEQGRIEMIARNAHVADAPTAAEVREQAIAGSGLGLLGLRERMEAMGGDLSVTRVPDFVLRARIPVPNLSEETA